ncbi:MAG: hypothetical protein ACI4Q4_05310 [Oscillospiraceae bacterium]
MENNDRLELKTKAFVADLLASVNIDDNIRNIIGYVIKEVGKFTRSDMVCVYESGAEHDCVNRVFQWRTGDAVVEDEKVQMLQERRLNAWIETLKNRKIVTVKQKKSQKKSQNFFQ